MNRFGLGIVALVGLSVVPAIAQPPKQVATPATAAKKEVAKPGTVGQAGMVVVRDADGTLRAPTAAEAQALTGSPAPSSSTSGAPTFGAPASGAPTVVLHPNGSSSVMLGPEHAVYSVVQKGPDGKLVFGERTGLKAATFAVQQGTIDQPISTQQKANQKGNANEK